MFSTTILAPEVCLERERNISSWTKPRWQSEYYISHQLTLEGVYGVYNVKIATMLHNYMYA